ncbi:MAG TPA: 2-amino-4-hydroxy-6-hydroxymethyldihydropteridine diphosphokinase [Myxococcales bacterium]|nr:2-amino-4-hydroxy-6-hydroxymethyldihydropteridine diphosphokinase [Myxococcales bacterium]
MTSTKVAIGLGSNLGEREHFLAYAIDSIASRVGKILHISSVYETEPVGGPIQSAYLNACVVCLSDLTPLELLQTLLSIESEAGRQRTERWGPRTLDLDLLLAGQVSVHHHTPLELVFPHPRLHLRRFVLAPLAEVAPSMQHPVFQHDVATLLDTCADSSPVVPFVPTTQRLRRSLVAHL